MAASEEHVSVAASEKHVPAAASEKYYLISTGPSIFVFLVQVYSAKLQLNIYLVKFCSFDMVLTWFAHFSSNKDVNILGSKQRHI